MAMELLEKIRATDREVFNVEAAKLAKQLDTIFDYRSKEWAETYELWRLAALLGSRPMATPYNP